MLTIRDAAPADAESIAQLTTQLGYAVDAATISVRLARLSGQRDQLVLVAMLDGKVAGWLQAHASEVLESGFRVEIVGLVVAEDCRRHGVGRELVKRVEQWAASLGAGTVVVRSNTKREESHRFYPALGYAATKTQAVYRKRLG